MKQRRMKPSESKAHLLVAAVKAAEVYGYSNFNRDHISEFSGKSATLITAYYPTVKQLKRAIMRYAIHNEVLSIVAEGIVTGCQQAKKADPELKQKALANIGV